ncbi:actin-binding LIM protein 1-like isoform X2 [Gigantopelta aegis]|uniref:actin-binding LIM protein 1-like isoform X2 n=1 Tax=Gigantopelta aegis TaxID=1735272 RepID=UPI001B88D4BA|nr:actin-binding LIM protein 1-like isoform X2 [Gigantopelta aegis]
MGQKPGKHREGEEDGRSSPRRSPKHSKRGSKTSRTSSRESTPPNIEALEREPRGGPPVREIVIEPKETSPSHTVPASAPKTKSPTKGEKMKSKEKKPARGEEQEVRQVEEGPVTPVKQDTSKVEPLTPLIINDKPQATSTPSAPNGVISTGVQNGSPPLSPDSGTDHSASEDEDEFTPNDQQFSFRSTSPTSSLTSASTNSSVIRHRQNGSGSLERKHEVNFGRFYNQSYLSNGSQSYMKRASLNPTEKSEKLKPGYHRPPNFSYSKETPDFLKAKKGKGMMALATGKTVIKIRRSASPADLKNDEAIKLSMFPAGKPPEPNEIEKIERDDWPGPASPAALLPEILRERRRSRGEKDEDDDEDDSEVEDPRIQRELEEISKIKNESGIGSVIYKELTERKILPHKPLDPWKASRAPNAKYEPRYRTRYQSPMFASPSRFLDRPRRSWDDSDIRGYRSLSTLTCVPAPKPGYGPSYGMTPRAATLPLSGLYGARDDFGYYHFEEGETSGEGHQRSTHTSSSTVNTDSSTRREGRVWGVTGAAGYEGPSISLLKLQKSTWHTEAEPPVYSYEKLKITNFDLPKDVDTNHLEIHLADTEFNDILGMPREKFYRLAEWKRNDLKRKHDLY